MGTIYCVGLFYDQLCNITLHLAKKISTEQSWFSVDCTENDVPSVVMVS